MCTHLGYPRPQPSSLMIQAPFCWPRTQTFPRTRKHSHVIIFLNLKAGRSGQFGDFMWTWFELPRYTLPTAHAWYMLSILDSLTSVHNIGSSDPPS